MKPRINWDAHEDVVQNHTQEAAILDRPVAAPASGTSRRAGCSTTRW